MPPIWLHIHFILCIQSEKKWWSYNWESRWWKNRMKRAELWHDIWCYGEPFGLYFAFHWLQVGLELNNNKSYWIHSNNCGSNSLSTTMEPSKLLLLSTAAPSSPFSPSTRTINTINMPHDHAVYGFSYTNFYTQTFLIKLIYNHKLWFTIFTFKLFFIIKRCVIKQFIFKI